MWAVSLGNTESVMVIYGLAWPAQGTAARR
jgi:hypothetical protein